MEVLLELMATIKELPSTDRPREKALRYGIETLSDVELIALLLNNGYQGNNVIEISTSLLHKYKGIVGLLTVPIKELKKNKGIKDVGALKIALICEFYRRINQKIYTIEKIKVDNTYLYNKYKSVFYLTNQEQLILIILNKQRRIIFETTLYKGSGDNFPFDYQDIYKEIVKYDGYSFYLIHNHPSGDCSPTKSDEIATFMISTEAKRNRRPLIDHLIIGDGCYYSFRKNEKITFSC